MLRKIRIILAAVFFIGVTLLFLDFTGTLHAWLGWMAKIQFLPAVLAVLHDSSKMELLSFICIKRLVPFKFFINYFVFFV